MPKDPTPPTDQAPPDARADHLTGPQARVIGAPDAPAAARAQGGEGVADRAGGGVLDMDRVMESFSRDCEPTAPEKKSKGRRPAEGSPPAPACDLPRAAPEVAVEVPPAPACDLPRAAPEVAVEVPPAPACDLPRAVPEVAVEVPPASVDAPGEPAAPVVLTVVKLPPNPRLVLAKADPRDATEAPRKVLVRMQARYRPGMKVPALPVDAGGLWRAVR